MIKSNNITAKPVRKVVSQKSKPPVDAFEPEEGEHRRFSIYIDGSNLYHALKKCGVDEKNFDYRAFADWLCGCHAETVRYYVGMVKVKGDSDQKTKRLYTSQQERFERLKKAGFYLVRGRLVNIRGIWQEKGVDVRIGVDIAIGASEDYYDTAYVVSSDSDLIPAIDHAIRSGRKEVVYVGFDIKGSYFSNHLVKRSSTAKIIKKENLKKFEKNTN